MTHTQSNEPNAVLEAQNKINGIQAAIISGNTKLTAADLSSARAALEFAQLQEQAAEIIKQNNAEAERKAKLLELQKRLETVSTSRKTVNSKFADLEKSLATYLQSCATYQNNLNSVRTSLREAGMHPGEQIAATAGKSLGEEFFGVRVSDVRRVLTIGSTSAENVTPEDGIKSLVEKSLGEYGRNF